MTRVTGVEDDDSDELPEMAVTAPTPLTNQTLSPLIVSPTESSSSLASTGNDMSFMARRKRSEGHSPTITDTMQRRISRVAMIMSKRDLEQAFQAMLSNHVGMSLFQDYCAKEYTLENLLFFLDVEVFRHSCAAYAAQELAQLQAEETGEIIPPSDITTADPDIYAEYILATYVRTDAPLQVNLTEEVREEVERVSTAKMDMFDEAQEAVYTLMKMHSFAQFLQSDVGIRWRSMQEKDLDTYLKSEITVPFAELFPPTLDLLVIPSAHPPSGDVPDFDDDAAARLRELTLTRALARFTVRPNFIYSSTIQETDEPMEIQATKYLQERKEATLTPLQKHRRVKSTKKLLQFFGQRPEPHAITRQLSRHGFGVKSETSQDDDAEITDDTYRQLEMQEYQEHLNDVPIDVEANVHTIHSKKKRADKLGEFFGKRVTGRDLVRQTLIMVSDKDDKERKNSVGSFIVRSLTKSKKKTSFKGVEEEEDEVTEEDFQKLGHRKLSDAQHKELQKRHAKLKGVLGESIDEDVVYDSLVKPMMRRASEMDPYPEGDLTGNDEDDTESSYRAHGVRLSQLGGDHLSINTTVTTDTMAEQRDREMRRKKLAKLSTLLGTRMELDVLEKRMAEKQLGMEIDPVLRYQNVGGSAIGEYTGEEGERAHMVRKTEKLERVFGQFPPNDMLPGYHIQAHATDMTLVTAAQGDIKKGSDMDGLTIDELLLDNSAVNSLIQRTDADSEDDEEEEEDEDPRPSTSSGALPPSKKEKRTKLKKLKKFFGHESAKEHQATLSGIELEDKKKRGIGFLRRRASWGGKVDDPSVNKTRSVSNVDSLDEQAKIQSARQAIAAAAQAAAQAAVQRSKSSKIVRKKWTRD